MFQSKKTILYFAPHQDDELLTMGIDISSSIIKKHDVHVILCTDGSKSNVRKILNNGKNCVKHEGAHIYDLSIEEFIQARDNEFLESCRALGLPASNIHIYEKRYIDGSLSTENAEAMIKHYLAIYGENCTVCTISPNNGSSQHRDHKALGKAAENLFAKKIIKELKLFVEPYHASKVLNSPLLQLQYPLIKKASPGIEKKVKNAINSYSCWNPVQKRYAIGFHSVTTEFNDFLLEMKTYYYPKKQWNLMNIFDKIDLKYRKWLKFQKQKLLFYSLSCCEQPDLKDLKLFTFQESQIDAYKDFCGKFNYKLRDKDLQRLTDGSSFWSLVSADNIVVSTGWLAYKQHFYIGETDFGFDMLHSKTGILFDFNTKAEYRGNGYYGLLLKSIVHHAKEPENFIIYTSPDNTSSSKGILKAGFQPDGTYCAEDKSIRRYLQQKDFTSITRKYQLWGLKVTK